MEWQNYNGIGSRIQLKFTKEMLLDAVKTAHQVTIAHAGHEITVYYKLKSKRIAGYDEVELSCRHKAKHPEDFLLC